MPDYPIPASAIEAGAEAMFFDDEGWCAVGRRRDTIQWEKVPEWIKDPLRKTATKALHAAFDELGMEWQTDGGLGKQGVHHRLVSRWMPVEPEK